MVSIFSPHTKKIFVKGDNEFNGTFWFVWEFANYCHMNIENWDCRTLFSPALCLLKYTYDRLFFSYTFVWYHSVLHIMFDLLCREGSLCINTIFLFFCTSFQLFMRQAQRNSDNYYCSCENCDIFGMLFEKGCPYRLITREVFHVKSVSRKI